MRCVLLLCALLCAAPAAAHDYPSQSIRLIVPFAAGGAVDAVARLLSDPISKGLGKPVVIDNRAGAGGVVGMDAAAQAPADGYTVLLAHSGFTAMPAFTASWRSTRCAISPASASRSQGSTSLWSIQACHCTQLRT
ncbi:MAG: tripartite tricarboxylate transporter substrate-binding protein [Xanthobacteraceae bacterium]